MGDTKPQQLGFLTNLANNGDAFKTKFGFSDPNFTAFQAAVAAAVLAQADADAAFAASKNATNAANSQINALIDSARAACNSARASDMSDADLASFNVARRSTTASPIPAPSVAPSLAIDSLVPGGCVISYSTPGSSGPRSRPAGAVGIQISLRAAGSTDLPEHGVIQLITTNYATVSTAAPVAPKLVAVGRYYTAAGLFGPWSDAITFNPQTV